MRKSKREHSIIPLLKELHWFPVKFRIWYNVGFQPLHIAILKDHSPHIDTVRVSRNLSAVSLSAILSGKVSQNPQNQAETSGQRSCTFLAPSVCSSLLVWCEKRRLVRLFLISVENPPVPSSSVVMQSLMSSDVGWRDWDKIRPVSKHGSMLLYVHRNHKAHWNGEPRTATSNFTASELWPSSFQLTYIYWLLQESSRLLFEIIARRCLCMGRWAWKEA